MENLQVCHGTRQTFEIDADDSFLVKRASLRTVGGLRFVVAKRGQ